MSGMMLRVKIDGEDREIELTPNQMSLVWERVTMENIKELMRSAIDGALEDGNITEEQAEELREHDVLNEMAEDYRYRMEDDENGLEIAQELVEFYAE